MQQHGQYLSHQEYSRRLHQQQQLALQNSSPGLHGQQWGHQQQHAPPLHPQQLGQADMGGGWQQAPAPAQHQQQGLGAARSDSSSVPNSPPFGPATQHPVAAPRDVRQHAQQYQQQAQLTQEELQLMHYSGGFAPYGTIGPPRGVYAARATATTANSVLPTHHAAAASYSPPEQALSPPLNQPSAPMPAATLNQPTAPMSAADASATQQLELPAAATRPATRADAHHERKPSFSSEEEFL